jgi:hypothetical protein
VVIATAAACIHTSPSPDDAVRRKLRGDTVSLFYGADLGLDGELLAVTDSSFIVMRARVWSQGEAQNGQTPFKLANPSGVVVVRRRSISRIEFGLVRINTPDGVLDPNAFDRVARRSRFPYGLSADAMVELLRASGQTKPDTIQLRSP